MARRYKATRTPQAVEELLGAVAAVVWFVTQGVGWLRLLAACTALGVGLLVGHAALTPVRGAASTWGPTTTVLAPAPPTAAPAVLGE